MLALPLSGAFGDPLPLKLTGNAIGDVPAGRTLEGLGAIFGVTAIRSPGVVVGAPGDGNTIRNTVAGVLSIGESGLVVEDNTIGSDEPLGQGRIATIKGDAGTRPVLDGVNVFGLLAAENTDARIGGAGAAGNDLVGCLVCAAAGGATSARNDLSGNTIGVSSTPEDADPTDLDDIGAGLGVVFSGGLDDSIGATAPNTFGGTGIGAMANAATNLRVLANTFDDAAAGVLAADTDGLQVQGNEITDSFLGLLLTGWEPTEKELAAAGITPEEWASLDRGLAYALPASSGMLDLVNAVEPGAGVEQGVALGDSPAAGRPSSARDGRSAQTTWSSRPTGSARPPVVPSATT